MADEQETKKSPEETREEAETVDAENEAGEAEPSKADETAVADGSAEEPSTAASEAAEEAPAPDAGAGAEAEKPEDKTAPQHTYEELHAMNVAQLRDVAATIEHDAVHGYTTMHKEHLLPAVCQALGIEAHEHHEVVGIDKARVKAQIRQLKKERDEAEAAGDKARLKLSRRRIRGLKRKIRKATV